MFSQHDKGAEVASYRARLQLLRSAMHAAVRSAKLAGPSSMADAAAQVRSSMRLTWNCTQGTDLSLHICVNPAVHLRNGQAAYRLSVTPTPVALRCSV